mgnify:CR=1 FL=1
MILTIIIFVLILSVFIISHELGHFISAKKLGMKVEEFGLGYPPKLFGVKKGDTLYSLNSIPFGGFVRIYGEQRADKKAKKSKQAFYAKPIWKRAIVIAMGVIMNLFLAVILLSIVHGIGVPTMINEGGEAAYKNVRIQIIEIVKNSPAEEAGLKVGDTISGLKIQSRKLEVKNVEDVQKSIARYAGEEITLVIQRGKETIEKTLIPRISPPQGEGAMGIALAKTGTIKYPWYAAIWQGFKVTGQLVVLFINLFWQLFKSLITEGKLMAGLTGPVGIAALTAQVSKLGLVYILQFAAIISINLAIINAFPFPALDGGRLLLLAIEKIKGSPVNAKIEQAINGLGFVFLIIIMILVTVRDVTRLF